MNTDAFGTTGLAGMLQCQYDGWTLHPVKYVAKVIDTVDLCPGKKKLPDFFMGTDGEEAVSYTHLDVYKRQEQKRLLIAWTIPGVEAGHIKQSIKRPFL